LLLLEELQRGHYQACQEVNQWDSEVPQMIEVDARQKDQLRQWEDYLGAGRIVRFFAATLAMEKRKQER